MPVFAKTKVSTNPNTQRICEQLDAALRAQNGDDTPQDSDYDNMQEAIMGLIVREDLHRDDSAFAFFREDPSYY